MRVLLLALVVFATAAHAQRPTAGQTAAMVAAGTACGLLAMTVVSPTAATGVGIVATVAAAPAGAATCVARVARRYGYEARFGPAFRDAALGAAGGALVGWGAGAATFVLVSLVVPGTDCGCIPVAIVPALAVGLTVFAATSAAWAVRGLPRHAVVAPTALRTPGGTTSAGVALRVRL